MQGPDYAPGVNERRSDHHSNKRADRSQNLLDHADLLFRILNGKNSTLPGVWTSARGALSCAILRFFLGINGIAYGEILDLAHIHQDRLLRQL